jgi:sulfite reductase (NADPH) hemoprotein beta-component
VRRDGERFLDTYRRLGMEPFKNVAYQEQLNAAYNG